MVAAEVKKLEKNSQQTYHTMANVHQLSPLDIATNGRTPFYKRQQTIAMNDEQLSSLDIATNNRQSFINKISPCENSTQCRSGN